MVDTEEIGYPTLEFLNVFAPIRKPAPIKDIFHAFKKAPPVANVWPAYNQLDSVGG
jgi:hypothetical protein